MRKNGRHCKITILEAIEMFGSKKNKLEEQIKEVFSEISEQRNIFEAGMTQAQEGEKRIHADVCQVMENTNDLVNNAMLNIEEESALIYSIDEFSRELRTAVEEYGQLTELLQQQMDSVTRLVEENKHVTSPAKYLTEAPAAMKQSNESYEKQLDEMTEYGRQMGVMALNAAIEAGRMGDSAKQFVAVSEEIRQTALAYEKAAVTMKEEIISSKAKIEEMEETIHRLVSLVKDSNMGTTRLLKKCQETHQAVKNSTMRDFSDDMILMRDKVVGMRNLDEEVAKCGERNKIQLSDIQEEIQTQRRELTELESDLSYLFDTAQEQLQ